MIIAPATSKRNRNSLDENSRDLKYSKVSQTQDHYLVSRGRLDTAENAVWFHSRAKTAVQASRQMIEEIDSKLILDNLGELSHQYAGSNTDRRLTIKYLYLAVFGAPKMDKWHDMKLVPVVSHMLGIPTNSHTYESESNTREDP